MKKRATSANLGMPSKPEKMKTNCPLVIHIEWVGPLSWKQKDGLDKLKDYGLYQIYGCHPVYGDDTLLYIGQANDQKFAQRLKQESNTWPWNQDAGRLTVYVGRLYRSQSLSNASEHREQIDLAERLLIFAHSPSQNCQKGINFDSERLGNVQVINWGCFRSLLLEVSGARHGSKFWKDMTLFER